MAISGARTSLLLDLEREVVVDFQAVDQELAGPLADADAGDGGLAPAGAPDVRLSSPWPWRGRVSDPRDRSPSQSGLGRFAGRRVRLVTGVGRGLVGSRAASACSARSSGVARPERRPRRAARRRGCGLGADAGGLGVRPRRDGGSAWASCRLGLGGLASRLGGADGARRGRGGPRGLRAGSGSGPGAGGWAPT